MKSTEAQTATQEKQKPQIKNPPRTQTKTSDKFSKDHEAVIGIETHVQLNNLTKAFCGFPNFLTIMGLHQTPVSAPFAWVCLVLRRF